MRLRRAPVAWQNRGDRHLPIKEAHVNWTRLVLAAAMLAVLPGAAAAQRSSGGSTGVHRFEITPYGGYSWTFARDFYYGPTLGRLDVSDSGIWGIALDINTPYQPGSQIELLYSRQDSELEFDTANLVGTGRNTADLSVEYLHIGGLYGQRRGQVFPFGVLTLGGTRYASKDLGEDIWKFSIIFGFGAKVYANERFGLRIQGRFPFSVFSGGGSVGCGSGGCYTSVGGTGLAQFDVGAGVMLLM